MSFSQKFGGVPKDVAVLTREPNQGIAMTAAASGSTGIKVADNDNIDMGTGNFTLVWKGSLPDWTWATDHTKLINKFQDSANRFYLAGMTTGTFQFYAVKTGGTTINCTGSIVNTFTDGTSHEIVAVITRETASVAGSCLFYVDGILFETKAIPAGTPADLSNTGALYINGDNTIRYASTTHHAYVLNFAPTAAEVLDMYRNGIPESWKWGSQTELVTNGSFTSGDTGWTKESNWTIADQGGGDYEAVAAGCVNGSVIMQTSITPALVIGNKYRVIYTITNYTEGGTQIRFGNGSYGTLRQATGTFSEDITIDDISSNRFGIYAIGTSTTLRVDDISCVRVGATLALEPEGIQPAPGQWLDSSSNKLHALQPATGSSLTRYKKTGEIRWTNTWAGTHEAQYIGGINQAILPANCYIESIVGVVSGATVEDIIVGDGSADTDHWVESTTGLAAGTYSFAIANRTSDGTNYKMVVDPDANFTGSIIWTIKYSILEA